MKSRVSFLSFALVASSLATSTLALAGAVTAGDRRVPPGFWVDFRLIGEGINTPAYEALETAISSALDEGNLREYKLVPYGREGERKVCFVFAESGSAFNVLAELTASGLMDSRIGVTSTLDCRD